LAGDIDWLSLDKVFILAYFYFHYDYLTSFLLGIVDFNPKAIPFPDLANVTTYLISMCLFLFLFGYNIYKGRLTFFLKEEERTIIQVRINRLILTTGKLLIIVGFSMIFLFIQNFGINNLIARDYGFNIFYSGDYATTLFTGGKLILSIGIIFLVIDWFGPQKKSTNQNLFNWFLLFLVAIYLMMVLILFSVRSWLVIDFFLPALYSYHYLRQRIEIKWLLLGFIVFGLISVGIELSRNVELRTIPIFIETFKYNLDKLQNDLSPLITTQFRTYKNVNQTVALINVRKDWFYGRTILGGVLHGIPLFGKYLAGDWYESPSTWLARAMEPWAIRYSEGIGFSLPAEIYINFGLLGSFIFFFLFGGFCARIYSKVILYRKPNLLSFLLYLCFTINLLFAIRQNTSSISRPVIGMLLTFILIRIISLFITNSPRNRI
jgi:oligosaccharide repeat unit polymerase